MAVLKRTFAAAVPTIWNALPSSPPPPWRTGQVPERWAFLPEVPKTSIGKFDKKLLRTRYAEGRPDIAESAGPSPP